MADQENLLADILSELKKINEFLYQLQKRCDSIESSVSMIESEVISIGSKISIN